MDRHARHLSLMALEGVDGGRSGDHPPARTSGSVTAATTAAGQPHPSPVGVDLGALRRGPLQLQHLLLQAGDGRPLLLEDGSRGSGSRRSRRRLIAGLGLARGRIGLREGGGRRGKVLPRAGEEVLVDPRVEVGPLPIGEDHGMVEVTACGCYGCAVILRPSTKINYG